VYRPSADHVPNNQLYHQKTGWTANQPFTGTHAIVFVPDHDQEKQIKTAKVRLMYP
jgi:hypothetical protein